VAVIVLVTGILIINAGPYNFGLAQMPAPPGQPANYSNTHAVGVLLFTQYVYAFEIAGALLLAAMIAAITLAHRPPHKRKIQRPADQVLVRPEDRVRLIKMQPEQKPQEGV
jgi:NADH-quinone oxidoreductase subunit J